MRKWNRVHRQSSRKPNKRSNRKQQSKGGSRRLGCEWLEDRSMLATLSVSVSHDNFSTPTDDGVLTLREAIAYVNGNPLGPLDAARVDTSQNPLFVNDVIDLTNLTGEIDLLHGQMLIDLDLGQQLARTLTITGPGLNVLTIDAQNNSRIFEINDFQGDLAIQDVKITGLTLKNGNSSGLNGGAISADENLTLSDMRFESNQGRNGGAVSLNTSQFQTLQYDLTVTNTEFVGNRAIGGSGGAIHVGGGPSHLAIVSLSGVTAWDNQADATGGAVNVSAEQLTIDGNSIFHTNTSA